MSDDPTAAPEQPIRRRDIWREGDRIRATNGSGYHDRVSDETIREHIVTNDGRDPLFVPFAEAVLAIRAFERASGVSR